MKDFRIVQSFRVETFMADLESSVNDDGWEIVSYSATAETTEHSRCYSALLSRDREE